MQFRALHCNRSLSQPPLLHVSLFYLINFIYLYGWLRITFAFCATQPVDILKIIFFFIQMFSFDDNSRQIWQYVEGKLIACLPRHFASLDSNCFSFRFLASIYVKSWEVSKWKSEEKNLFFDAFIQDYHFLLLKLHNASD